METTKTQRHPSQSKILKNQPLTPAEAKIAVNQLKATILPWDTDGSFPSNLIRTDGLGRVIAKIDRHAGQANAHKPLTLYWEVRFPGSSRLQHATIRVWKGNVNAAIARAMKQADAAIEELRYR